MFGTVSGALQEVDWIFVIRVVAAVLPIWIFGAVVGLLVRAPLHPHFAKLCRAFRRALISPLSTRTSLGPVPGN